MAAPLKMLGHAFGILASTTILLSVAAIPWMLGGVIPLARLTLLLSAIFAAVCSLASSLLLRQPLRTIPFLQLPLVGLSCLGLFQLRSVAVPSIAGIKNSLLQIPEFLEQTSQSTSASLSPSDTRLNVAMFLALGLVSASAFQRFRTTKSLAIGGAILVANTVVSAAVGLVQLFSVDEFFLNTIWNFAPRAGRHSYATFINPNNAAGWLCLGFAVSVGWLSYQLQKSSHQEKQKYGRLNTPQWEQLWRRSINFTADLTPWQILWIVLVGFIAASVLATLSRGGIVALVLGTAIATTLRSSARKLSALVLVTIVCGCGVYGLLHWFDLDNDVRNELETLQDIDTTSDTRSILWLDSLQAFRDFPICGTGLGSFKFAIMPYQSQNTTVWFRNAENQFIEMLVEGGAIGLTLFSLVGIIGFMTGFSGWRQRKNRHISRSGSAEHVSRRVLGAVGLSAMLASLTQLIAAMFDFGIGLPATASMLVLILAATGGFLDQTEAPRKWTHRISIPCHPLGVAGAQICLIIAAIGFVPDLLRAVEIDRSIVAGQKILARPTTLEKLQAINGTVDQLKSDLRSRPDDSEGLRVLSRLSIFQVRWETLQLQDPSIVSAKNIGSIWTRFSLLTVVELLATLRSEDPYASAELLDSISKVQSKYSTSLLLKKISSTYPLLPGIATSQAQLAAINRSDDFHLALNHATFVKPASSRNAFRLGMLALRNQSPEKAKQLWQRSIELSDIYRSAIMQASEAHWNAEQTMNWFGPDTYEACVLAARSARSTDLRMTLWAKADSLWEDVEQPPPEETCSLRAKHLLHRDKRDDAIAWLEKCLKLPGDNLQLSRDLAPLLEKDGRYRDAISQWNRILYLRPKDATAAAALTRINEMKRLGK